MILGSNKEAHRKAYSAGMGGLKDILKGCK